MTYIQVWRKLPSEDFSTLVKLDVIPQSIFNFIIQF